MSGEDSIKSINEQAFNHYLNGDFNKAELLYKQIVKDSNATPMEIAKAKFDLATSYKTFGQYQKAKDNFMAVRTTLENKFGGDDPQIALDLRQLGDVCQLQGNFDEANKLQRRALAIWQDYLLPPTATTDISSNDFESLYGRKSENEQIILMLAAAKQIPNNLFLNDLSSFVTVIYELAALYRTFGKYKTSEKLLGKALEEIDLESLSASVLLMELAQTNYLIGNYDKTIRYFRQVLSIFQKHKLNKHPAIPNLYYQLAKSLLAVGSASEAEELLLKAQSILESTLTEQHPTSAYILKELASINKIKKQYLQAEIAYKQAIDILRSLLGNKHRDLADFYDCLAVLYDAQKKYADAEAWWFRALDITANEDGSQPIEAVRFYDRLACLYRNQSQYERAESIYRQSLTIRKQILVGCQNDIANTHFDLAKFYLDWDKYIDSEKYFASALELANTLFGANNPRSAQCQEGLGIAAMRLGKYKEAETILKQAIDNKAEKGLPLNSTLLALAELYIILDKQNLAISLLSRAQQNIIDSKGKADPAVIPVLNMMALSYSDKGDIDKAIELSQSTLSIMEVQPDYPLLVSTLISLAELNDRKNQTQKAAKLLDQAVLIVQEKLGEKSKEMILALYALGEHHLRAKSWHNAFSFYKPALSLCEKTLGGQHLLSAKILCQLGQYYQKDNQPIRAIEMYIRAVSILEKIYNCGHPNLAKALMGLAKVHISQNHKTEAEPLLKRALTMLESSLGFSHRLTAEVSNF